MSTDANASADEQHDAENVGGLNQAYMLYASLAAAVLVIAVIVILIARTIDPAPPRYVLLSTGSDGGAYAAAGVLLSDRLGDDGVRLELVPSSGSVENLERLIEGLGEEGSAANGGVDAAIVQGGVGLVMGRAAGLESLGALFYEPLWLFTRAGEDVSDLRDLRGRRVAVGPDGSGVRALAAELFAENGLADGGATLSPLGGGEAAAALRRGEIDAAIFVTSMATGYVNDLLRDPGVELVSIERAAAYARRHRYLSAVTLPRGVVDLEQDIPSTDVQLIAPAAALVIDPGLHPAIQSLLMQAAMEGYREGDVLAAPGVFPSRDLVSFPLSEEASRYFERGGPSFLQRYLPFWAADLVDRLWLLAIPLATLLYPLVKAAPPIYRWQVKRRIIRWYKELRRLETEGRSADTLAETARVRAELSHMLTEVGHLKVPLPYNDDVYRLRTHIRMVDEIVAESAEESGVPRALETKSA